MIKKIYICDRCGIDTDQSDKVRYVELLTYSGDMMYQKMVCLLCYSDIKKLIDFNYMVLDPEDLRK